MTEVYVARTTVKDMYSKWEFYNGSGWSENSGSAVAMTGISSVAVSSQFNVFKLRDKYVLFTSAKNWDSRKEVHKHTKWKQRFPNSTKTLLD